MGASSPKPEMCALSQSRDSGWCQGQRAVVSFPSPVRQGVPWCFWGEASKRVARETVIPKFHMRVQSCSVAACCGPRSSNTFCRNVRASSLCMWQHAHGHMPCASLVEAEEFLDMHLSKLEEHDQEFDSAFLYQLQASACPRCIRHTLISAR